MIIDAVAEKVCLGLDLGSCAVADLAYVQDGGKTCKRCSSSTEGHVQACCADGVVYTKKLKGIIEKVPSPQPKGIFTKSSAPRKAGVSPRQCFNASKFMIKLKDIIDKMGGPSSSFSPNHAITPLTIEEQNLVHFLQQNSAVVDSETLLLLPQHFDVVDPAGCEVIEGGEGSRKLKLVLQVI